MGESPTNFLFASPNFWTGFGSTIDMFGVMFEFNRSLTPEQADWLAQHSDWLAVGHDIMYAMSEFRAEQPELEALRERT